MALPPRTPPRFVPTLTEVVQVPGAQLAQRAATVAATAPQLPAAAAASGAPSGAQQMAPAAHPPSPQPQTSTELHLTTAAVPLPFAPPVPPAVQTTPKISTGVFTAAVTPVSAFALHGAPAAVAWAPPGSATTTPPPVTIAQGLPDGMEEYMVHRVMQRVDVVLDQRLRDAIATVVQEQTRSVLPRLREEIESVVRHAVYEAVADELAGGSTTLSRR